VDYSRNPGEGDRSRVAHHGIVGLMLLIARGISFGCTYEKPALPLRKRNEQADLVLADLYRVIQAA
jgi:hypothetical protein